MFKANTKDDQNPSDRYSHGYEDVELSLLALAS